ncbi:MAG TPA: type II toxin-antitoxin system RelE/ParE family toxin [Longimicrobium sp.]
MGDRRHRRVRGLVPRPDRRGEGGRDRERGPAGGAGAAARFPHTSGVHGSRHAHMRELRIQHAGRPYRILYAFDPRRAAILLLGGDKTGDDRWYVTNVPLADDLYDDHLDQLRKEGLLR